MDNRILLVFEGLSNTSPLFISAMFPLCMQRRILLCLGACCATLASPTFKVMQAISAKTVVRFVRRAVVGLWIVAHGVTDRNDKNSGDK